MTNTEKALLFRAISVTALFVAVYGGGLALLIWGIVKLPWLIGKIACGLLIIWGIGRTITAYYATK